MGPERGFRAGSKGRQGGLSQRRGLGPQLPFGRGANRDTQAGRQWPLVPLCPSRGLLAPGFSCPGGPEVRGSRQGLPSSCSGPCPQSSVLRSTNFLGIFSKAYTTRLETHPASFLVQNHSFAPKPKLLPGHLSQHRTRVQSQPGPQ